MKKKTIGISATKLILIIVAIIIVALLVPQFFKKSNKNSLGNNKNATENSTKEDEIIQSISPRKKIEKALTSVLFLIRRWNTVVSSIPR